VVQRTAGAVCLALMLGACADQPSAPEVPAIHPQAQVQEQEGSGIILENLTGLSLPLIGQIGTIVIDEAVITNLVVVEDVVGNIVGVEAEGLITFTGGLLGTDVITEDFATLLKVTSGGPGQCDVLSVDIGPLALDALGGLVSVDVPEAVVNTRSAGALGQLLCALGQALQGLVSGVTATIRELVDLINAILI
jgi:hypothetical protein